MLPFIENDEVWAIARIMDKTAASEMAQMALSTSPSVVFRDPAVNMRLDLDDGSQLLIEGPASLLDHVAICRNGVWDKDDGPTGVVASEREEEFSDEALTHIADSVDGIEERMNIFAILQHLEMLEGAQGHGAR